MPNYTYDNEIQHHIIFQDLSSSFCANIEKIHDLQNILIIAKIHTHGTSWTSPSGNFNYNWRGNIELLNCDGTSSDGILHNDWKMQIAYSCTDPASNNRSSQFFKVKFIDAFGIENIDGIYPISALGLITAYKRFVILSKYKGYKVSLLEFEKSELKTENQLLKENIVELNKEILRLKDHLAHLG